MDFRDWAILTLAFSALHNGVNVLSIEHEPPDGVSICPYDDPGSVFLILFIFVLYLPSVFIVQSEQAIAIRDLLGIIPGIWFQVTVKPRGYFASVPVEGCDIRSSGYAMVLWLLGEIITFGATVRLLPQAWKKSRVWTVLGVIVGIPISLLGSHAFTSVVPHVFPF